MTDELLEVVDAQDRVIGLESRREIHRRQLMHRSAHILVFNGDDALFLQRRALAKDACPGMWDSSAAGHVDPGESYAACARRELHEELGIAEPLDFACLGTMAARPETGFEHCRVFQCRYHGAMRLDPGEVAGGEWLAWQQMERRVTAGDATITPSLRLIWTRFSARLPGAPL